MGDGRRFRLCMAASLCLAVSVAAGQQAKTVIGPSNPELHDGAQALLAGDAEEGVRLTLEGLTRAPTSRERLLGMTNLCAGYIMLKQLDTALDYCNRVIAEDDRRWQAFSNRALIYVMLRQYDEAAADLDKAEAISPNSRTVKVVRSMLRDKTEPVVPNIVIDDRREPAENNEH
ncbi:MAG: tetratricopeptide repeat protein [Woeseiaceae bacterium]